MKNNSHDKIGYNIRSKVIVLKWKEYSIQNKMNSNFKFNKLMP